VRTLNAHFDGKNIVLDDPATLKPNTQVHVIVPDDSEAEAEIVKSCARLSETCFQKNLG